MKYRPGKPFPLFVKYHTESETFKPSLHQNCHMSTWLCDVILEYYNILVVC